MRELLIGGGVVIGIGFFWWLFRRLMRTERITGLAPPPDVIEAAADAGEGNVKAAADLGTAQGEHRAEVHDINHTLARESEHERLADLARRRRR